MSEINVRKLIGELNTEEARNLLVLLAEHFSPETTVITVPIGTEYLTVYKISTFVRPDNTVEAYSDGFVIIKLISFFGIFVGYSAKIDLLVC